MDYADAARDCLSIELAQHSGISCPFVRRIFRFRELLNLNPGGFELKRQSLPVILQII